MHVLFQHVFVAKTFLSEKQNMHKCNQIHRELCVSINK
jgi:hypothetical protein